MKTESNAYRSQQVGFGLHTPLSARIIQILGPFITTQSTPFSVGGTTTVNLLRLVGKAVARQGLNLLALGLPVGDVLIDAFEEWAKQTPEKDRETELLILTEASPAELSKELATIRQSELAALPPHAQAALAMWLGQFSATVRQKLGELKTSNRKVATSGQLPHEPRALLKKLGELPDPRTAHRQSLAELLRYDHSLNGGVLIGLDGSIVEVQGRAVQVLNKPKPWRQVTTITGLARGAISEVLQRLTGAFTKLQLPHPQVEILINLKPADLPKEGTWLDLPIAIVLLQSAGLLPELLEHHQGNFVLFGEIGIHGEISRVPGALSIAYLAKPGQDLIVPASNEKECALIRARPLYESNRVCGADTLHEVVEFFRGVRPLESAVKHGIQYENVLPRSPDFGVIRGQRPAKEAACIAAAGGHNLLLIGPPGEGKSLLASALPGILPRLTPEEKVLLTKIYSACGALDRDGVAVTRRPFRSVHHTVSRQALVGGGSRMPRPGEITLAHLGVLFLDELAEFSTSSLEAMRQPLESGEITISRVGGTVTYPCQFSLIAAMNPCPCGHYGTPKCHCKKSDVQKYQQKLSGPIWDRIDLKVEMPAISTEERFSNSSREVSRDIRARIEAARAKQRRRFTGTVIPFNAAIPAGKVREYCQFSPDAFGTYKQIITNHSVSTRAMDRLAKAARTVADLEDSEMIEQDHLAIAQRFVMGDNFASVSSESPGAATFNWLELQT